MCLPTPHHQQEQFQYAVLSWHYLLLIILDSFSVNLIYEEKIKYQNKRDGKDLKYEDKFKYEDDCKYEADLEYENDLKYA